MRRLVWPGVAWLLVAVSTPLAAQRAGDPPAPRLEEPRPAPAFPAALVPFSIPDEWCQGGGRPAVSVRVFDPLIQPIKALQLRGGSRLVLDSLPLRCGNHIAYWNGTLGEPPRLPPRMVYRVQVQLWRSGFQTQRSNIRIVVPTQ